MENQFQDIFERNSDQCRKTKVLLKARYNGIQNRLNLLIMDQLTDERHALRQKKKKHLWDLISDDHNMILTDAIYVFFLLDWLVWNSSIYHHVHCFSLNRYTKLIKIICSTNDAIMPFSHIFDRTIEFEHIICDFFVHKTRTIDTESPIHHWYVI
jgi:hypothetical protein